MPVISHEIHESVIQKDGAKYGCHNNPNRFKSSYQFWDRHLGAWVGIPHRMSTDCRFDTSLTDQKCEGCNDRGSGEEYDRSVRAAGS